MKWLVKIEGKPNQRIVVKFDPLNQQLIFTGQYKQHNVEWFNFVEIRKDYDISPVRSAYDFELITAEEIQNVISEVYLSLKKRVEIYEEINKGFSLIKLIAEKSDETDVTEVK